MNRGQNNGTQRRATAFSPVNNEDDTSANKHNDMGESNSRPHMPTGGNDDNKLFRIAGGALIVIVALLIASALALFIFSKPSSEARYVNNEKLQAVFLTNDQVYFGKITSVNSRYLVLSNVYYLQTANTNNKETAGQISLIKLGCELHRPQDRMVINQEQVSFWENLNSDGQVAKLVDKFQQANPNGQKCDDNNTATTPVQGSTDTTNTPATTTPKTNGSGQ